MGRAQGAGISDPPLQTVGSLQGAYSSQVAKGGVQRQGMGTVTTEGQWVGRGPSHTPPAPTFGSQVSCLSHNQHTPLEQMGEPVLMDSANDIEDFGLSEDLVSPQFPNPDSHSGCAHLLQGRMGLLPHRGTVHQWTSGW